EALEVGGLRAGPAAGDEEVPAELEVERGKLRVVVPHRIADPLVRRPPGGLGGAQVERDPAEETPVLGDVVLEEAVEGAAGGLLDGLPGILLGVAARVAPTP